MADRGPRTLDLAEEVKELSQEVKVASKGLSDLRAEFGEFRVEVRTQLGIIKWVAVFFAGVLLTVVAGAGRVVWDAATITAEVKQQGKRLDAIDAKLEKTDRRLDGIDAKLEILIRRAETKPGS